MTCRSEARPPGRTMRGPADDQDDGGTERPDAGRLARRFSRRACPARCPGTRACSFSGREGQATAAGIAAIHHHRVGDGLRQSQANFVGPLRSIPPQPRAGRGHPVACRGRQRSAGRLDPADDVVPRWRPPRRHDVPRPPRRPRQHLRLRLRRGPPQPPQVRPRSRPTRRPRESVAALPPHNSLRSRTSWSSATARPPASGSPAPTTARRRPDRSPSCSRSRGTASAVGDGTVMHPCTRYSFPADP